VHKCWFRSLARSFGSINIFCFINVVVDAVLVDELSKSESESKSDGIVSFITIRSVLVALESDSAVAVDVNTDNDAIIIAKHTT
jgi:hypothetical protein